MGKEDHRVFDDALKLPPEARAALAGILIESLDAGVDADAESSWSEEIERRARGLDGAKVRGIPWSKARRTILDG